MPSLVTNAGSLGDAVQPFEEIATGILQLHLVECDFCNALVSATANCGWKASTVAEVRGFSVIEYARDDIRSSLSIGELGSAHLMNEIYAAIRPMALRVFGEYWGLTRLTTNHPQLTKYERGHFIKTHTDDGAAYPNRVGSVVTYLSDNYSGGEISFPKFRIQFKPKAASTIIFPSEYVHEVRPIIHGTKYIFLFFIEVQNEG